MSKFLCGALVAFIIACGSGICLAEGDPGSPVETLQPLQPIPSIDIGPLRFLPDLKVNKVWLARYKSTPYQPLTNPKTGDRAYLVCEFSNAGKAFKGMWKVGYFVDGVKIYGQSFSGLPSGTTRNPAAPYVIQSSGPHTYECVVDFENSIAEQNERNNRLKTSFNALCSPAASASLAVPLHPQETGWWCWAASGQMVMDFLGHNVSQCTEANNRFGRTDCCNINLCPPPTQTGHACVNGGWPEFDKYGFTFQRTASVALTWDQLKEQLSCLKKPVAFSWAWPGGSGHMMVAIGYKTVNGVNYVDILDPWSPCSGDRLTITYDEYNQRQNHHSHWDDFYNITYTGGH